MTGSFFFNRRQADLIGIEEHKKGLFGFVGAYFAAESKNSYKCRIFLVSGLFNQPTVFFFHNKSASASPN